MTNGSFVAPYLTLLPLDAEQRRHDLRGVFNALRWLVRSGAHWRMPGCFEAMAHDLHRLLRLSAGRQGHCQYFRHRHNLTVPKFFYGKAGYRQVDHHCAINLLS
jgi:hypothetical protein